MSKCMKINFKIYSNSFQNTYKYISKWIQTHWKSIQKLIYKDTNTYYKYKYIWKYISNVNKYLIWKWCRMCAKCATVYPVRWKAWCTVSKNNHQHISISKALSNKLITFTQKQVIMLSFINLTKLHFVVCGTKKKKQI